MKPIHDVINEVYFYMASYGVKKAKIIKIERDTDNPHTWDCIVEFSEIDQVGVTKLRLDETELFKNLDDLKEATLKKITDRFETEKRSLIEDIEMYNE